MGHQKRSAKYRNPYLRGLAELAEARNQRIKREYREFLKKSRHGLDKGGEAKRSDGDTGAVPSSGEAVSGGNVTPSQATQRANKPGQPSRADDGPEEVPEVKAEDQVKSGRSTGTKRDELRRKMRKKSKSGQPIMGVRIANMLEKLRSN